MKIKISLLLLLGLMRSSEAQYYNNTVDNKGGIMAANQAQLVEQQRIAYQKTEEQREEQAYILAAEQQELALIYSKDPWRNISGTTNLARGDGWLEFQGQVQEIRPDGVIFKGRYGQVLTVNTELDENEHLIRNFEAQEVDRAKGKTTQGDYNSASDTRLVHPKVYGEDVFFVEGFPYPADHMRGYEEMMALSGDYYTYTNDAKEKRTQKIS